MRMLACLGIIVAATAAAGLARSADEPPGAAPPDAAAKTADDRGAETGRAAADAPPAAAGDVCLPEPLHWSGRPAFGDGVEVTLVRFLRFETPDGRKIAAKAFLIEVRPERACLRGESEERTAKRRAVPPRMFCVGFEIAADDRFTPDYDVPARYVKRRSDCSYAVELGTVTCNVRTTGNVRTTDRR